MAIHLYESTMSCDKGMRSSKLPIIALLIQPIPSFVDLSKVSFAKPKLTYHGERAKWGTYKTEDERRIAKIARNRRWQLAHPEWYDRQKKKQKEKRDAARAEKIANGIPVRGRRPS